MAKLKFGGPNLKPGQRTWYFHQNEDGSDAGQVFVTVGAVVDEARVCAHVGDAEDGSRILGPNADYYVRTGRAERMKD